MRLPVPVVLLIACFFWGISFIATKVAVGTVPPLTVVALRLLIAALCFAPILARRRAAIFAGGAGRWWGLLALSVIGTGLHHGTQTVGVGHTTASNASLWAMTGPVSITLIAAFFLGEKVTARKAGGIALAIAGVLVVKWQELRDLDLRSHLMGDGLVFVSIFLWAVFTVYGKRLNAALGALELIGTVTVIGALWMLPVGLGEMWLRGFSLAQIGWQAWLAIGFLGITCSFLANLLYFQALGRTESQKVGVYLYTIPPMTYAASWLLLDERIGAGLIVGSLLIAGGVWLTEKG